MTLGALNVDNRLEPLKAEPVPQVGWRQARAEDLSWAKEHLVPWVIRLIRHQSSGDNVLPKRPDAAPVTLLGSGSDHDPETDESAKQSLG